MQWQGDWDGRVRVKVGAPKRCANCVGREGDRGLGGVTVRVEEVCDCVGKEVTAY